MENELNPAPQETPETPQIPTPEPTPEQTIVPEVVELPIEKKSSLLLPGIISLLVLGLIGGSIYFFYFREDKTEVKEVVIEKENAIEAETTSTTPKLPKLPGGCTELPAKLEACEAYTCDFKHPITGEMMTRKIIGLENDKCQYTEEMPNGGNMTCNFTEPSRMAVAQLHKEADSTDSEANPLAEAISNGECVISGYGNEAAKTENNNEFEIIWGNFSAKTDNYGDLWVMTIEVNNNQDQIVIMEIEASDPKDISHWENSSIIRANTKGETIQYETDQRTHNFETGKNDGDPIFIKRKITVTAYECSKLPEETEFCTKPQGMIKQWDILKERKNAGNPINPTLVVTKYFDFNSLDTPPVEITENEYLQ